MIILDSFEFLVNNTELGIQIDCPVADIKDLRWDGKNVIILSMENGTQYLLTNILPLIRNILKEIKTVLVIFKHEETILEAYEVDLIHDTSLEFDDFFEQEAQSCYEEIQKLAQNQQPK